MRFYRALSVFFRLLLLPDCEHPRVRKTGRANHCPDCGYEIRFRWALTKCRDCNTKRIPVKLSDDRIKPLDPYCRQCGSHHYRVVKTDHLAAQDILYGIALREVHYDDPQQPAEPKTAEPGPQRPNPFTLFGTKKPHIVDGQVLRKETITLTVA